MTDTVLGHPLVRGYLRALDEACAALPYGQARELREQIACHLEEALPPGTGDADIRAELDRLGRPYVIAAAAAGPVPPSAGRRLLSRLGRVRWWTWALTALLVPALGAGVWVLVAMNSVAPLVMESSEWLYPVDQGRAVQATADAITQTTVPDRFGQRQGIEVLLVNESDWTQRIVGFGPGFQPFSGSPWQAAVQTGPDINPLGVLLSGGDSYVPWGAIPPHSTRWVDLTWIDNSCMGTGGATIVDYVSLEVRVGVATKTENIPLLDAFALTGTRQSSSCS